MAEFNLIKTRYGFEAADDAEFESLKRYPVGALLTADIKLPRKWEYHKKMFSFFGFCFEYWCGSQGKTEFMTSKAQQKEFRNNLTILAGYYEQVFDVKGGMHLRAKSLSFANMDQEEFEECANAMINAALKHIFLGSADENIINRLYSYF